MIILKSITLFLNENTHSRTKKDSAVSNIGGGEPYTFETTISKKALFKIAI
ncbi:MAG TPA: hypothetical protein PK566_18045 [Pseudobacteroides sp.]|nr:hypothetical protein [Pseudobacteroides sp.]